jgi:hypothetical protein
MSLSWSGNGSPVVAVRAALTRPLDFGGAFVERYPGEREALVLALVCAVDMLTTLWWVARGIASEANPLLAWTLDHHPLLFVLLKCATFLPPLLLVPRLGRERPEFTRRALAFACLAYIGIYVLAVF